ncbi:MAG TPA: hypothetical protein PLT86_14445 [Candidatus Latescibacteria bacterium]|nr:hypothetical protein [Candidatus Latescibacterota bacterium]HQK23685.1 hypothetical protein [Candidatus Latescibacterota bacterium]
MRDIARLPADDRSDLFRLTAQAMNVHEAATANDTVPTRGWSEV